MDGGQYGVTVGIHCTRRLWQSGSARKCWYDVAQGLGRGMFPGKEFSEVKRPRAVNVRSEGHASHCPRELAGVPALQLGKGISDRIDGTKRAEDEMTLGRIIIL